jgi:peptidoglycan/xylan/chitin deacetylase (PgdA/CDA1 family)
MQLLWAGLLAGFVMLNVSLAPTEAQQTSAPTSQVGATRIASWKDDKKAAFLLMFDDSIPSHFNTVIPELQKRGMGATFYVNPGRGEWLKFKDKWETEIPALPGMVYGNHTWSHKGIIGLDKAEEEIGKTNALIFKLFPGKQPRLLSFGRPGVKKEQWKISEDELKQVLAKHHLIERPTFSNHGAMVAFKTAPEMLALADKAIANNSMEYIVFHGVGAEWITTPVETFTALLDGLAAKRDQLWITDHISAHQYETERANAEVKVLESSNQRIRLTLQSKADPQFYDLPLTLITQVPQNWRQCTITQGAKRSAASANGGNLQFEALPNGEPIIIQPANTR